MKNEKMLLSKLLLDDDDDDDDSFATICQESLHYLPLSTTLQLLKRLHSHPLSVSWCS